MGIIAYANFKLGSRVKGKTSNSLRKHAHAIYCEFWASNFNGCKNDNFQYNIFSYFSLKHRLWVHVRTASNEIVLTSTYNL